MESTAQPKLLIYFRKLAMLEGWSLLLLFFFAMPMKYLAGVPIFVTYIGWVHGLLFVLYGLMLLKCWLELGWKFSFVFIAFGCSLVPFAMFWLDKKLAKM
jgi:integral membrane protein